MSKTPLEVAGEITVALIEKLVIEKRPDGDSKWEVTPEYLAPKIAEAFKTIYRAVNSPD